MKLTTVITHNLELSTTDLGILKGLLITVKANSHTDLRDDKLIAEILAAIDREGV